MKHFRLSEFACRCHRPECDAVPMDSHTLALADELRDMWGKPLIVDSGTRCAFRNASPAVKGAKDSQHLRGKAIDFKTANRAESHALAAAAEKVGFTGIGTYDTWVHADTGPKRSWQA